MVEVIDDLWVLFCRQFQSLCDRDGDARSIHVAFHLFGNFESLCDIDLKIRGSCGAKVCIVELHLCRGAEPFRLNLSGQEAAI